MVSPPGTSALQDPARAPLHRVRGGAGQGRADTGLCVDTTPASPERPQSVRALNVLFATRNLSGPKTTLGAGGHLSCSPQVTLE